MKQSKEIYEKRDLSSISLRLRYFYALNPSEFLYEVDSIDLGLPVIN